MVKIKDEDENDLLENDIDESDDEDEDDSGDKSSKKDDDEEEIEIEIEDDEKKDDRVVVQTRKPREQETTEEKRARRREERKKKNSRNYANAREAEALRRENAEIKKQLAELHGMAGEFGKREAQRDEQQINDAINAQTTLFRTAESQFAKAISEGEGDAAKQAQRIMTDAQIKYEKLTSLKATHEANRRAETEKKPTETEKKDNRLQVMYTQRFLAQNDWFDPSGADEDSKTAKEIDNEVAAEGYDPNTKEYWDEVKKRIKEEIPHVFKNDDGVRRTLKANPRPKQVNGSMGADSGSSNGGKTKIKIPVHVVKMAKDAGQWDDPKMQKIFIKNWQAQQSGAN